MAEFDPITLGILWNRLIAIADEAAATMVRTSFSTLVRESNDFAFVLTDAAGGSLAQSSASIGSFIGTLPQTVKHFLRAIPADQLEPGDVLITNDIWMGTGHLPDLSLAKPIFHRGRLVAFASSTAHLPDIGGRIRSPDPREVFEEGLQIPIMKLIAAGRVDQTLIKILRKNVRLPDQVEGDLMAQVSADELAARRLLELIEEYGIEDVADLASVIQGRSERAMRDAIAAIPDGTYHAEAETDGLAEPIRLRLALTVDGEAITLDYAGTSPQVDRALNVAFCYTYSYTAYGVKAVLAPTIPNNDGCFRPVRVLAPEGSILNHKYPGAGGARMLVGHYLPYVACQALGQAAPEKVLAASGSPLWCVNFNGLLRDGRRSAGLFFFNGGMGGSARQDGATCLSFPSNVSNTPIEVVERISPFTIESKAIIPDSGGAGMFRGGCGQRVLLRNDSPEPLGVAFMAERTKVAAPGMSGGAPGRRGAVLLNGQPINPKETGVIRPGDRITLETPGGGGFGDPRRRDRARLQRDLEAGFVIEEGVRLYTGGV